MLTNEQFCLWRDCFIFPLRSGTVPRTQFIDSFWVLWPKLLPFLFVATKVPFLGGVRIREGVDRC